MVDPTLGYDRAVRPHALQAEAVTRWVHWLDGMISTSAAAMQAELGDQTACRVHRDGRVTGGLKFHEGRMTAFAEARRMARVADQLDDAYLTDYRERWERELEHRISAARPSPPWVAYATGAAEAAAEAEVAWRRSHAESSDGLRPTRDHP